MLAQIQSVHTLTGVFHLEAADEAETLKHIQVNYHRLVVT